MQEEEKQAKNGTLRYSPSESATEESVAPTCTQKPLPGPKAHSPECLASAVRQQC